MTSLDKIERVPIAAPDAVGNPGHRPAVELTETMKLLPLFGEHALLTLGQVPATSHLAQQYLRGLAWGITPALWFLAIRGFMGAVNRPEPGLWITLAAIPANATLVYLLIYGGLGL